MRRSPKTNSSVQRRGFPSSGTQLFGWAPALRGVSPSSFSAPHPTHAILRGGSGSPSRGLFSSHPPPVSFLPSVIFFLRTARSSLGTYPWFRTRLPSCAYYGLVAKAPSGLSGLDSTLVRTPAFQKRLPIRARQTSRQYPSGGAFISSFSPFLFLFGPAG